MSKFEIKMPKLGEMCIRDSYKALGGGWEQNP